MTVREAMAHRFDQATSSARRTWLVVFFVCALPYLLTAHWYGINNSDTIAAAWPAYEFAHRQTFFLEDSVGLPFTPWFSDSGGHLVSNRMPGVILIGVPMQVLLLPLGLHALTPATLTAVLVTAAAMANLCVLLMKMGGDPKIAVAWSLALAFGTGFWPNASAELWTHGPDAFWLSLAMLAAHARRPWLVGAAMAPAVMTRPHLAVAAAAIGVSLAISSRSAATLVRVGLPSAAGLGALTWWNSWMFGDTTIAGGYTYAGPAVTSTAASAWNAMGTSALGSLVSPLRGLLVFSPFVAIAVWAALRGLRHAPAWAAGAAVGGLGYQLVQWRVNAFMGGTGYYSYRLPLELLVLVSPLVVVGYRRLANQRRGVQTLTGWLVGVSVAFHAIGVFWFKPILGPAQERDPWRTWGVADAAVSRGTAGTLLATLLGILVILACRVAWPIRTTHHELLSASAGPERQRVHS